MVIAFKLPTGRGEVAWLGLADTSQATTALPENGLAAAGPDTSDLIDTELADGADSITESGTRFSTLFGTTGHDLLRREIADLAHLPTLTSQPLSRAYRGDESAAFLSDLNARIEAVRAEGVTNREIARHVGISSQMVSLFLKGEVRDYQTHIAQRLCLLFNVRYNYLPFAGKPLSGRREIWSAVEGRLLSLGITPPEFATYFGMELHALRAIILGGDGPLPREIWDLLVDRLHMRLAPLPKNEMLSEADVPRIYEDLKKYQERVRMTDAEMSQVLECRGAAHFSEMSSRKPVDSYVTRNAARLLGYELFSTHDGLSEWPRVCLMNRDLADALETQRVALGISDYELTQRVGITDHHAYRLMIRFLRGEISRRSKEESSRSQDVPKNRDMLLRFAGFLKIPLFVPVRVQEAWEKDVEVFPQVQQPRLVTLPSMRFIPSSDGWNQNLPKLFKTLRDLRRSMWISARETYRGAHLSNEVLAELERASDAPAYELERRRIGTLEDWLDFFDVRIDPFSFLQPLELDHEPTASELVGIVRERAEACPVSTGKMGKLVGASSESRHFTLDAQRAASHDLSRRLAAWLKISWPGLVPVETAADPSAHSAPLDVSELMAGRISSVTAGVVRAPTRLLIKVDEAREWIRRIAKARRWTVARICEEAGITRNEYDDIIKKRLKKEESHFTPSMMRLCRALGIRFSGLPFPDALQTDVREILEDFDARVAELGFTDEEARELFGKSFVSVRAELQASIHDPSRLGAETVRKLNQALHMRAIPLCIYEPAGNRQQDAIALGALVKSQRELSGLTHEKIEKLFGISIESQKKIESGENIDDKTLPALEKSIQVWQIQHDPFAALTPVFWPESATMATASELGDWLRRAARRCVISNLRLENLAGIPSPQDRANAFFGSASPAKADKPWVRCLAALFKIHLPSQNADEQRAEQIEHALQVAGLSDAEFCKRYDVCVQDLWKARSGSVAEDDPVSVHIATLLDLDFPYQYLDASLYAVISARMKRRGIRKTPLSEKIGVHYNSVDIAFDYLQRSSGSERTTSGSIRQIIYQICDELEIPLWYRKRIRRGIRVTSVDAAVDRDESQQPDEADENNLPVIQYAAGSTWKPEALRKLGTTIHIMRLKLGLHEQELAHLCGVGVGNIKSIEAGEIVVGNRAALHAILSLFRININKLEGLPGIFVSSSLSGPRLAILLRERMNQCLLSPRDLDELAGVDGNTRNVILDGSWAVTRPEVRAVAIGLRIQIVDEEQLQNIPAENIWTPPPIEDPDQKLTELSASEQHLFATGLKELHDSGITDLSRLAQCLDVTEEELSALISGNRERVTVATHRLLHNLMRLVHAPMHNEVIVTSTRLSAALMSKRVEYGLTVVQVCILLGFDENDYYNVAGGHYREETSYYCENTRKLCAFFKIRFNWTDFSGPPLRPGKSALQDFEQRIKKLDWQDADAEACIEKPIQDLRRQLAGEMPLDDAQRKRLMRRLHMRLLPTMDSWITPRNLVSVVARMKDERDHWHMTAVECCEILGVSSDALNRFEKFPTLEDPILQIYARELGCEIVAKDPRPWPDVPLIRERQFYGDKLQKLVRQQMAHLGLDEAGLARRAGVEERLVPGFFDLFEDLTSSSKRFKTEKRGEYAKIPACLNIQVYDPDKMEELQVLQLSPASTREATCNLIARTLVARRAGLLLSKNEVEARTGLTGQTIATLETGHIVPRNAHLAHQLLRYFKVTLDPLAVLRPTSLVRPQGEELAHVLRSRIDCLVVAPSQLYEMAQITSDDYERILAGKVDPCKIANERARRLAKVLKVDVSCSDGAVKPVEPIRPVTSPPARPLVTRPASPPPEKSAPVPIRRPAPVFEKPRPPMPAQRPAVIPPVPLPAKDLEAARERQQQAIRELEERAAARRAQEVAARREQEAIAAAEQAQAQRLREERERNDAAELARIERASEERRQRDEAERQHALGEREKLSLSGNPIWVHESRGEDPHADFRRTLRERILVMWGGFKLREISEIGADDPRKITCRERLLASPFLLSPGQVHALLNNGSSGRGVVPSDPAVQRLSMDLKVFSPDVLQHMLLSHGENPGEILAALSGVFDRLPALFRPSFSSDAELVAIMARRRSIVRSISESRMLGKSCDRQMLASQHGFEDASGLADFLECTGADFTTSDAIPDRLLYLLFSFGDVDSVVHRLLIEREINSRTPSRDRPVRADLLVEKFLHGYHAWLRRTYESHSFDDGTADARLIHTGRRILPIHKSDRELRDRLSALISLKINTQAAKNNQPGRSGKKDRDDLLMRGGEVFAGRPSK